jgi:hypothetical protein
LQPPLRDLVRLYLEKRSTCENQLLHIVTLHSLHMQKWFALFWAILFNRSLFACLESRQLLRVGDDMDGANQLGLDLNC